MEGVDVPPVLVVISTEKEFEHGPLSSSIIYDSVSIESPNESYYARENWNDNDSFDEVKHELLGRSANEIYFWGKEFRRKKQELTPVDEAESIANDVHDVKEEDFDPFEQYSIR